jgi:glycosyltransferase involved in cell wall biosynthesis
VPRFHTNQIGWVTSLQSQSVHVEMLVCSIGATEDHGGLTPVALPESCVSALLRRVFGDGGPNRRRYFPNPWSLWSHLNLLRPDLVVIRPHGLVFTMMAGMLSRVRGLRVVLYRQEVPPPTRSLVFWAKRPRLLIYSLLLRCISPTTFTPIWDSGSEPSRLPPGWKIVPFVVPLIAAGVEQGEATPIRLVTIGKFVPRKRLDLLLQAMARLVAEGAPIALDVIGECSSASHERELESLQALARQLALDDRVRWHPNVEPQRVSAYLCRAHLFVLPAQDEPASVALIEALGCGLPVVCSDSCGTRCYVQPGITGEVFACGSVDSLVASLATLIADLPALAARGRAARESAAGLASRGAFLDRFLPMMPNRPVARS